MDKKTCAQQHFGPWAIESKWMQQAIASIRAGTFQPKAFDIPGFDNDEKDDPFDDELPYEVVDGVAVICIEDQITKHESSFGGTSTVCTRRAVRQAAKDSQIKSILLKIDSPGGTVSGVSDLSYDIKKAKKSKPVCAYIEDMCCSAAYWIAAQCDSVTSNETAIIGSIGVYTVLYDESGAYEMAGVKTRLVTSGGVKGAGADGKVTQELVDDTQREINSLNEHFLTAVADGRGMNIEIVRSWNDGKVYIGQEAVDIGMIDGIGSLDDAIASISNKGKNMNGETFAKYAAENPDAAEVKAIIDKGLKAGKITGKSESVSELRALMEAIPGRPDFVIEQFVKGHDVLAAKAELSDLLIKELDEAKKASVTTDAPVAIDNHAGFPAVPLALPNVSADEVEEANTGKKNVVERNDDGSFVFRPNYSKVNK